jgi:transcriptional regulator with XRE-family HTH domain
MEQMTSAEMEASIGENLKRLRLLRNLEQKVLAEQPGVSLRALQRLENGEGSSLGTLVRVLRALGRQDWLKTIAPLATVNPMTSVVAGTKWTAFYMGETQHISPE